MKRQSSGSLLSTVFVDYDNIYLSLKRKSEEAAKRFAKDAGVWVQALTSGDLISPTNSPSVSTPRRIVMNRCYGNPVPRRNAQDNATDMNSFPFVRHHFLRAGFEVIDCPPLTAQLKNSADIRMVMDVRDYILHDTYFDEFIILSGDADFTPVLHRLRQHARRTVIYSNDYTAPPYKAISDGEVREADLIALLVEGEVPAEIGADSELGVRGLPSPEKLALTRKEILGEVLRTVRAAQQPVPLEALADRAVRLLGHDKTVGSAWGGAGSFRDLIAAGLPSELKLSDAAPYYVYDAVPGGSGSKRQEPLRQDTAEPQPARVEPKLPMGETSPSSKDPGFEPAHAESPPQHTSGQRQTQIPLRSSAIDTEQASQAPIMPMQGAPQSGPRQHGSIVQQQAAPGFERNQAEPFEHDYSATPARSSAPAVQSQPMMAREEPAVGGAPVGVPQTTERPESKPSVSGEGASALHKSIARIHEACKAPPLSPPEYAALFEVMAAEINSNGLTGARTLVNIVDRAQDLGVRLRRDDARFILEVVSEADPWFEQGASSALFASRFRNFVIARCRDQGLSLSASELDLIDAWFSGTSRNQRGAAQPGGAQLGGGSQTGSNPGHAPAAESSYSDGDRPAGGGAALHNSDRLGPDDAFPRIVRKRARTT